MKETLKYFVEIADVTEPNGNSQIGDTVGCRILMLYQLSRVKNTVFQ
jgi:hypothetical protein